MNLLHFTKIHSRIVIVEQFIHCFHEFQQGLSKMFDHNFILYLAFRFNYDIQMWDIRKILKLHSKKTLQNVTAV